jgi:Domain of unknown function (DUF4351)
MSDDYDSPWKEILDTYFPEFLAFAFPEIHRDVDWSRGYESLDKELPKILRKAKTGRRVVDKLVKVWRRDGEEQVVFIHVEFQGDYEAEFPRRIFVYNYRVFDRVQCPVVSLVILGDEHPSWRPRRYRQDLWGCRTDFSFPVLKLWDYNERWPELEASDNPFAAAVMVHLKTRATRKDAQGRLRWKLQMVRHLYERGFERRDAEQLFRFIDWLMALPEELEERFGVELRQLEGETKMPYVTPFERRAIEKGRAEGLNEGKQLGLDEGLQQGVVSVLKRLLARRFEQLPEWAEARLEKASRDELEHWADRVIDAESLEQVFAAS